MYLAVYFISYYFFFPVIYRQWYSRALLRAVARRYRIEADTIRRNKIGRNERYEREDRFYAVIFIRTCTCMYKGKVAQRSLTFER